MNKKMGFTLLELLTVVVIIATLTAIAVPQYRRTIQRAQATEALMNLRTIFEAAMRYKAQYSSTPQNLQGLDVGFFDAVPVPGQSNASVIGNFLYEFTNDAIHASRLDGDMYTREHTYSFRAFYNNPDYGGRGAMICQSFSKKYDSICPAFGEPSEENPAIYVLDKIEEDDDDEISKPVEEVINKPIRWK